MTALDPFGPTTVGKPDFKRDRWGRPLIVPAGGTKAEPYTRASGIAKSIEDRYTLEQWGNRMVAYGSLDQSIRARLHAVGGTPQDWTYEQKQAVNAIVSDAFEVAKAKQAADIGTAVHRMVERINLGEVVDGGDYAADLEAYRLALHAYDLEVVPSLIECRLACDAIRAAGTMDMALRRTHANRYFTTNASDLKTGTTIEYALLAYAAQLAVYANSDVYRVEDDSRTPLDVSTEVGYLIHLPAGQGRCSIYEVDLVAGFKAARLANTVTAVRKAAKGWATKVHEVAA